MKIYYDSNTENIVIENDERLFSKSSLEAVADGNNIAISYKNTNVNNLFISYLDIEDEDGNTVAGTVQDVVDYLNSEFNKDGVIEGVGNFTLLQNVVTIVDNRLTDGDVIFINPTVNVVNEFYFSTIVNNNSFTVNRFIINNLGSLTSGLPFRWRKLR